jgi:hypothetical protein
MAKLVRKARRKKAGPIRKAYQKIEARVMAAVGRVAVKGSSRRAKEITRKAAKAAALAASLAAAKVVLDEIRKQRQRSA